jgi:enoyl-CoA hydratase
MRDKDLLYTVNKGVATITLNRPERMNALTLDLEERLHVLLDKADGNKKVKVIILTGSGTAFCAGYDMAPEANGKKKTIPIGQSTADLIEFWHRIDGTHSVLWTHLWRLGKPVIAAVNGWALGSGFWYQLAADITIASDKAVFAQPEVRHISNTSYLFTALCGWKAANRWALTGDHFDAQEAYRMGMVNEVVPHDQLMQRTGELARRLALVPEPSLRLNKAISMLGLQASGTYSALLLEGALSALVHSSHNEFREKLNEVQRSKGMKAYLEMRDGPFQPEPMGPRSKPRVKKSF